MRKLDSKFMKQISGYNEKRMVTMMAMYSAIIPEAQYSSYIDATLNKSYGTDRSMLH